MNQHLKEKKILLIDKDSQTEILLYKVLQDIDFRIVKFSSGKEGLETLSKLNPHLIISAFRTKDLDGRTVFSTLMNDGNFSDFRHIPFVLFSDENIRSLYSQELFNLGLQSWLTKPLKVRELRKVIEKLFTTHEILERNLELSQEVRRSEYRYRDLLENANDFIFTLDNKGNFVYLNNRFTSLTGYEKEEWIGKSFLSIIDHTDRNIALEHYKIAHQGRARIFEAQILGNNMEPSILSFNITPILERGTIVGSMGIGRDITDRKKMEKEILDLKNFNESIIQSMEAGLLTIDLDGRITSLNAGGEKIIGWKLNEVVGKHIKSVLKPEEVDFLLSKPSLPGSLSFSRETQLTIKEGRKISIGFTAMDRLDNQTQKVGTIVSFRDITQIKQMQSEVIRMDRLASLGVLSSGIAHEIKNPLAGIKTMAQACEEEFDELDCRREYLSRIIRQVNRLNDLLKTFFAYAKPKPPDRKHHKLTKILREVNHLVAKKMTSSNINYIENIEPDLPEIMVDSQQMQQVFLNLILNAIEAMPSGGTLKITAIKTKTSRHDFIKEKREKNKKEKYIFVEIKVSDTGDGIEPENMETIFDPFFTTKPDGLGLGLSIVYRIIDEHCGDIQVESNVGKGTFFTITLPTGVES